MARVFSKLRGKLMEYESEINFMHSEMIISIREHDQLMTALEMTKLLIGKMEHG